MKLKNINNAKIVIKEYCDKNITREEASTRLGVHQNTISRLKSEYLRLGDKAFIHGNANKTPVNKISPETESAIVELYKSEYQKADFNFSHFYDYIKDSGKLYQLTHGEMIPSRTISRILKRNNIISPQANKKPKDDGSHPSRPRRPYSGELIQTDGSLHDWLDLGSKSKITLHSAIDDTTSTILAGYFLPTETLDGYFTILKQIIIKYGIPQTIYTDRRNIFEYMKGKIKENERIQFEIACKKLSIKIITTSTAQAKGRIERSFRTFQDRLCSELKLKHIKTIDQANEYLQGFINRHNKRFAIPMQACSTKFRPLPSYLDLDNILARSTIRTVLQGNIISFKNKQFYPIDKDNKRVILKEGIKVEVIERLDKQILLEHQNNYYELALLANRSATARTPAKNHPWRLTYNNSQKK